MIDLNKPVGVLPKIGPRYQYLLKRLEIHTLNDLIHHLPFRYEDFSNVKKIKDVLEEEVVTIEAVLDNIDNIYTKYGKKLTKAKVGDETGYLDVIWFNQHYIKTVMEPGENYNFSGKVGHFGKKLTLINPEFEIIKKNTLNTKRLVPIYSETLGVSSKWLRTRINDVLSQVETVEEFIPENLILNNNLMEIDKAIKTIHFPNNLEEANTARLRFEFEELFMEMLKTEIRKTEWNKKSASHEIKIKNDQIQSFISSLPFILTDAQNEALKEVFDDLQKPHPMNRLLEGDVGTGKTMVAIIAAYAVHLNSLKTVYMAPTEILAQQHFETFKKFLDPFNIKIRSVLGGMNASSDTDFDIAIGTHALLENKNGFEKVGFVIIDEQHRFGVEQRAQLVFLSHDTKNNLKPHLLSMTATPIPRTLALTLYGDLSISTLKTSPQKNKKIITKVIPEKMRQKAYEWILNKNESTFIVCPLISESEVESMENIKAAEKEFKTLSSTVFSDQKIGLLHGRMKSKEKKEVVDKFRRGEIKILVSTPVIEVGIDVPEASIMVIESAERYGLASLHQLRGRVGRGGQPGYCLVFMSNNSRAGYSRLKKLEEINEGIKLAEIDMKMRGHGDIYGIMQHGFKKLKYADINNLELLERTKKEAQKIFSELDNYPKLKDKLHEFQISMVEKN
ncbi:MAG: hypothetical protein ACD_24C00490G0007 [uncultured bacterium]|uniref:Uncharacterized protein n=1 Tax=candidate division WWE3 bacterium RBG_16_37_10 TaxID=1802610 RepID=A0A1F4UTN2_UNCKA|nr:MAG: hypothetical protein ACD_24C00490G0007 [uncultured bacterium]OGC48262.1 MAG: hypothetical protein A2W32_03540 [candidate division WWE3 bacterium RBG_16_37_10]